MIGGALLLLLPAAGWAQGSDNPECLGAECGRPGEGSFTIWPAADQHGTVAFEDLWPSKGDADYNDLGLRVHVRRTEDVGGNTTALVYTFVVWSLGARKCAAAALRLPNEPDGNLTVQRFFGTAGSVTGAPWTSDPADAVSDGAGGSVIPISEDVRAQLCGGAEGFLNTTPGSPTTSCAPVALRVTYATASANPVEAPGDVFWYECGDPGTQVHRSIHPGVPGGPFAADPSLFGTGDDASETGPGADRFYVDAAGVPWALTFSDGVSNLPAENRDIATVLPDILDFAAGTGGLDFWHHPEPGAFVFAGAPPVLPYAPFVGVEGQSCRGIDDAWGPGTPPDGVYRLDPDGGGPIAPFDAWCRFDALGGWTRVARLDTVTRAYCGGDPAPEHDLRADPFLPAGKLPDGVVQALVAPYGDPRVLYYTGQPGLSEFVHRPIDETYRTDIRIDRCDGWTCADGSPDATACGDERTGCGFSGPGVGGTAKKLYLDSDYAAHVASLHTAGDFCGLDNRARHAADVYVR